MKDVKKDYKMGEVTVEALKNVNLTLIEGEFVAVYGPSGSGKTTLLNIIGTIDNPSSGKIYIHGEDVFSFNDNKITEMRNKTISFIFQKFNLIPVLSAFENVLLPLQIKGIYGKEARDKAMLRLAEVGLADFIHHRPDKLSGGQQQRVAIARALVTQPSIVIADEPTANLDSVTSKKIMTLMRQLNEKEKTTFIFSTHDQRILDQVDRLISLEDGIIKVGETGNEQLD